jgi:hypothetical protein
MGLNYPKGYAFVFSCASLIGHGAKQETETPATRYCGSPPWAKYVCHNSNSYWGGWPKFGKQCAETSKHYSQSCATQSNDAAIPKLGGYGSVFGVRSGCGHSAGYYGCYVYSCGPGSSHDRQPSDSKNYTPYWCSPTSKARHFCSINFAAADAAYARTSGAHLHALGRVYCEVSA